MAPTLHLTKSMLAVLTLASSTLAAPSWSTANTTYSPPSNSTLAFSTPPYEIAADANLTEFRVHIPDQDLQDLETYLKLFKAPATTYENSAVGWFFGLPKEWLVDGVDYWLNTFNWRKEEEKLNSIPQFKLAITDDDGYPYSIHFAALFSENKDAIPLILSHGWPDSFMIYMPMLQAIQEQYADTPDQLPYHIIVPSLVGIGFSSAPNPAKPFYNIDNARIFNKFMVSLGFGENGYIAHGIDVGAMVSEYMLAGYDECKASHVTLWWGHPAYNATTQLPANSLEVYALNRMASIQTSGQASVLLHEGRSSTAGLTIGSSPVSILAWFGEKMVLWSEPTKPLSYDVIVPNVALYWLNKNYQTSYWCYAQFRTSTPDNSTLPGYPAKSGKPEGFSWFPNDVSDPPKAFFDDNSDVYTNFYQHDDGAHFAPTEQPAVLWADLTDFASKVWQS